MMTQGPTAAQILAKNNGSPCGQPTAERWAPGFCGMCSGVGLGAALRLYISNKGGGWRFVAGVNGLIKFQK